MGSSVTQIQRSRPIFIRIVVATTSATAASNWFEMPKSGQSELMPPSGSITPFGCSPKSTDAQVAMIRSRQLTLDLISRDRIRFELTYSLLLLFTIPAPRWSNKKGKDERNGHQPRNKVEGLGVVSVDLPQISER
jgi:hypothetical protein